MVNRQSVGGGGNMGPTDPFEFLKKAIEAVPSVRYALGVGGIAAAIAIVAGFLDLRIALVGIPIVFIFMTILVVFSRLAGDIPGLRWAVTVIVAFSVAILIVATILFAVTFFVRVDVLHGWGLNSFYELFNLTPNSGAPATASQ